jgi:dUTP pyrophosphatase
MSNKYGVADFQKVSCEQWVADLISSCCQIEGFGDWEWVEMYDQIKLPVRATKGSAGYDFVTPFDITLNPRESILIPTGIRVFIDNGWVLMCYPRSGLGFKYRIQLDNTVGIIDSDYVYSDNEGHIMAKITNDSKENNVLKLNQGDAFMQGVFVPYGITYDDKVSEIRNGGFGSTGR